MNAALRAHDDGQLAPGRGQGAQPGAAAAHLHRPWPGALRGGVAAGIGNRGRTAGGEEHAEERGAAGHEAIVAFDALVCRV